MEVAPLTGDVRRYRSLYVDGRPGTRSYVVLLGLRAFELPALMRLIERGLPWTVLGRFAKNTGLSVEQIAELISIAPRTLARRRAEGRLASDESDRLLRAARIYGRALDLFDGNARDATEWVTGENRALGGATPLAYARTEVGAEEVDHLIGRIEHGIVS